MQVVKLACQSFFAAWLWGLVATTSAADYDQRLQLLEDDLVGGPLLRSNYEIMYGWAQNRAIDSWRKNIGVCREIYQEVTDEQLMSDYLRVCSEFEEEKFVRKVLGEYAFARFVFSGQPQGAKQVLCETRLEKVGALRLEYFLAKADAGTHIRIIRETVKECREQEGEKSMRLFSWYYQDFLQLYGEEATLEDYNDYRIVGAFVNPTYHVFLGWSLYPDDPDPDQLAGWKVQGHLPESILMEGLFVSDPELKARYGFYQVDAPELDPAFWGVER